MENHTREYIDKKGKQTIVTYIYKNNPSDQALENLAKALKKFVEKDMINEKLMKEKLRNIEE